MRFGLPCAAFVAGCVLAGPTTASADVLYDNGPTNGQSDGYLLTGGYAVSNSFSLASRDALTGANFDVWLSSTSETLSAVEWTVSGAKLGGGIVYGTGTAAVTESYQGRGYGNLPVYVASVAMPVASLGPGTYFLTLQSAQTSVAGGAVWWLQTTSGDGPSTAYGSAYPPTYQLAGLYGCGITCSEGFQVLGNTVPVPEPSSGVLLFAGVAGLAARVAAARLRPQNV